MFTLAQLVCCLLVPGCLALALGAFRQYSERGPAIGLGGGILVFSALVGHLTAALTAGDALWPPRDGWHWAIFACFALTLLILVRPLGPVRGWTPSFLSVVLHGLLAGLGAWLLLRPLANLSRGEITAWAMGFAVITGVTAALTEVGLNGTRRMGWLALAGAAAGTAAGVVAGGSKDLGLLAGTLAAAASALAIAGTPTTGAGAGVIPMGWFALVGVHYASLHPASAGFLLAAPSTIALAQIPAIARHPRLADALRQFAPLAVSGLGIALGIALTPKDNGPTY